MTHSPTPWRAVAYCLYDDHVIFVLRGRTGQGAQGIAWHYSIGGKMTHTPPILELFYKIVQWHDLIDGSVITDHVTHRLGHWQITIAGEHPSNGQPSFTADVTSDKYLCAMVVGPFDGVSFAEDMEDMLLADLDAALVIEQ